MWMQKHGVYETELYEQFNGFTPTKIELKQYDDYYLNCVLRG